MSTTIGVDLGGTKILAAIVDKGTVGATTKVATPTDGVDSVLDAVVDLVKELGGADEIGIGVPGQIDHAEGVLVEAPNLVGFDEPVPVAKRLAESLPKAEIRLDNDVNVAALGEARHGAGKGADDLLAVWCGTGVGGGLVLGGQVRRGRAGVAGEIGHMVVEMNDGRQCHCGGVGHLEAYAGRSALEAEARRRHAAGEKTALVEIAGDDRMKSSTFRKALLAGDAVTESLIDEAVVALGAGIASATLLLDIDLVVIGGGLAEKLGDVFIGRIEQAVRSRKFGSLSVRVVPSQLGDDSGVVGAAGLFDS